MAVMAAGAVITAEGLWMPGTKLISIPSGTVFGNEYGINSTFKLLDAKTVQYVGAEDKVVSVTDFHEWLKKNAAYMMKEDNPEYISHLMVAMRDDYRLTNPEHLHLGSLSQIAIDHPGQREMWISNTHLAADDLDTDKFYYPEGTTPIMSPRKRGNPDVIYPSRHAVVNHTPCSRWVAPCVFFGELDA